MTGLMGKVKEALHPSHSKTEDSTNHGTHSSNAANKADPRIDSDRDHRAAPGSTVGSTGNYTTSDNYTHTSGTTSGLHSDNRGIDSNAPRTDGPHSSNLMNKADPRVDSDRDHSRNMGANPSGTATTGTHNTTATSGLHNTTGTHNTTGLGSSTHGTTGVHSGAAGPHSSNLANKADPRVDSDLDRSRNMGMNPSGTATTGTHTSTGLGSSTHGTSTNHGPHSSNLANKADPRVDSDLDRSRNMGMNTTTGAHTGVAGGSAGVGGFNSGTSTHTGTHGTTGLHSDNRGIDSNASRSDGPHSSNLMNKADPRVDSDRDHSRNMGANPHGTATTGTGTTGTSGLSSTHGTHNTTGLGSSTHTSTTHGAHGTTGMTGNNLPGPAEKTAGPHKSDMMNKIDPRVDSDLDGSKTMMNKDPTDAAQVPPSVLQKHIGPPVVEHDDHHHDRTKRHSVSHQEEHRGL